MAAAGGGSIMAAAGAAAAEGTRGGDACVCVGGGAGVRGPLENSEIQNATFTCSLSAGQAGRMVSTRQSLPTAAVQYAASEEALWLRRS